MRRMVSLLACMAIMILPLITFAAAQPKFDWWGGPSGIVLEKSLAEISAEAAYQAVFYGEPIEYKTPDGSMVLKVYADFGKECEKVYVKAWDRGKLVMNTTKEFCEVSYPVPDTR